jgi:hypothetical protein
VPLAARRSKHSLVCSLYLLFVKKEDAKGSTTFTLHSVGASGKLGQYLVQHALDRSCEVVAAPTPFRLPFP